MAINLLPLNTPEDSARYITAAKKIFNEHFVEIARNGELTTTEGIQRATSLLEMGVDINHRGKHGNTALHFTVDCETQDALKWLLAHGADPNVGNDPGDTSLHWALMGVQNPDVIYTLLTAGANPRQKNDAGQTPIDVSMYDGPIMDALHSAVAAYEARQALEELARPVKNSGP